MADYEARLGKPFPPRSLQERAGGPPRPVEARVVRTTVRGIATGCSGRRMIKALRESNSVEVAPERAARKAVRAERSVTVRIRAKLSEQPAHPASEVIVPPVETTPEPVQKPEEPPAAPPAACGHHAGAVQAAERPREGGDEAEASRWGATSAVLRRPLIAAPVLI